MKDYDPDASISVEDVGVHGSRLMATFNNSPYK
jgi:hypothetical protein